MKKTFLDLLKQPITNSYLTDINKKSIKENNEMNTETLAEIYLKQGNYPRAIEIYEHLMLSNPEKKLFFASRIKFIKLKTQL